MFSMMKIMGMSAGREKGYWHQLTSTFKHEEHRNLRSNHKGNTS